VYFRKSVASATRVDRMTKQERGDEV